MFYAIYIWVGWGVYGETEENLSYKLGEFKISKILKYYQFLHVDFYTVPISTKSKIFNLSRTLR